MDKEGVPTERPSAPSPVHDVNPYNRNASMNLVEKGRAFLDGGAVDMAAALFRDAVSIDATNGVAYYHLAIIYSMEEDPAKALGVLDKAESLLGSDSQWKARIDELRSDIEGRANEPGPAKTAPQSGF